jgi:hypothetical protein
MCLWEDCTSNENGTEWDYGCTIKGHDFEEKYCFVPYPIRWLRNRRALYFQNHEYDGIDKWYEREEKADKIFCDFFENEFNLKDEYQLAGDLRSKYDAFLNEDLPKNLREKWKVLLRETFNRHWFLLKSYFCK